MAVELRSNKKSIFLVGDLNYQITGAKLPSNRQVLAVLFFNIREVKLSVSEKEEVPILSLVALHVLAAEVPRSNALPKLLFANMPPSLFLPYEPTLTAIKL